MRALRLFQSCCLLIAYMLPASRAVGVPIANSSSKPWPYMAFVYYTDDSIRDANGARFVRGAVLLTPEHLLVSSMDRVNATEGFPEKTLVARAGAITVDDAFTVNEDENEQEREVTKVYRPSKESDKWWSADMQLVRVVEAFNITPAVNVSSRLPPLHDPLHDKMQCSLLFYYRRFKNNSSDMILTEASLGLLPMSQCPNNEPDNLTICTGPLNSTSEHGDYCLGNSGGPVICNDHLTAMHSIYTEGCSAPHLYKTIDTWAFFINCSIEDTCNSSECSEVCIAEPKDPIDSPAPSTGNKTAEELDEVELDPLTDLTNATAHKQIRTVTSSNETGVLEISHTAVVANNDSIAKSKVRTTSKKGVHLRTNAAVCSLRVPSDIVYFIVSRLALGLYSYDFINA